LSFFVDTNVWSMALRRDALSAAPEVGVLVRVIESGESILQPPAII
jgi:hypothetical protein